MKRIRDSFAAVILLLALFAGLTSCGPVDPSMFDDGANRFGAGKTEENYDLPNSGAMLARLIDEFSGSMKPPSSHKMDDDDYDEARRKAEEERKNTGGGTGTGTGSGGGGSSAGNQPGVPQGPSGIAQVGNYDQLKQVFLEAYVPSAPRVQFEAVNGYDPDLSANLEDIYRELQRQDPIGVAAVASWSSGMRGNEYIVEITYNIETDKLNRMKSETPALVQKAIQEMNVGSTDHYEIIDAVNEYLCDTIVYPPNQPYAPETHTAHGAFNGDAVCEGYAIAAKLMLNEFGINCDIQSGVCTNGGGHAWNLVELEGQWYQLDVTWNDGGNRRKDYFLVTDAYMKKSRSWDESDYPKSATTPYQP